MSFLDSLSAALWLQSREGAGQCSISGSTDAERLQSAEQLIHQLSRCEPTVKRSD